MSLNLEADPAMSSVKKEEANDVESTLDWKSTDLEFLKLVKPEEYAPPLVTGFIKLETMTHELPETELGIGCETLASDLKTETYQAVSQEMNEVEEDVYDGLPPGWEAAGVKNGRMELRYELVGTSGMGCKTEDESERLEEDSLDVSSGQNEEGKPAASSEVSVMEHIVEKVSAKEIILDDVRDAEDVAPPGWEAVAINGDGETVLPASVESIPLPIKTEDDDEPLPGSEAMVSKGEEEPVPPASVESIPLQIEMEEDDGPPPGSEAMVSKGEVDPVPPESESVESSLLEIKTEGVWPTVDKIAAPDLEYNDDKDGPPLGWEATVSKDEVEHAPPALFESIPLDIKTEGVWPIVDKIAAPDLEYNDDKDGPPPGWEATVSKDEVELAPPALFESIPLEIKTVEMRSTKDELAASCIGNNKNDDGPPPGWEAAATKDTGAEEASVKPEKGKEKEEEEEDQEHLLPRPLLPSKAPSTTYDMGQVVCGSCWNLLSYAKGAEYVQCVCCQTVNFVLEAHQVGQVYCGGCSVLLMYRFGSPAVKCSVCKFITQIATHNRRPPLSEQGVTLQSQLAQLCPRPTTNLAQ